MRPDGRADSQLDKFRLTSEATTHNIMLCVKRQEQQHPCQQPASWNPLCQCWWEELVSVSERTETAEKSALTDGSELKNLFFLVCDSLFSTVLIDFPSSLKV
jgi:hypothetical protein